MAKEVLMPRMGYDMDEGTLLRWLKQIGDTIERGEPIAEIETDKTNLEIESFEGGVIHKFLIDEGDTVPVGQAIAVVGAEGEEIPEDSGSAPAESEPEEAQPEPTAESEQPAVTASSNGAEQQSQPQAQPQQAQVTERKPGERVRASPLVRRLAAEHGLDLQQINGTGPGGRIIKDDVLPLVGTPQAPLAQPEATPAGQEAPAPAASAASFSQDGVESELQDMSRLRKTIAKRMSESFTQQPHFYVSNAIDMGNAMALRKQINAEVEDDAHKVSVNDLVVKATALALRKFPMLNAAYENDQVRVYPRIDINMAIAVEGGLLSPFIPDADNKPIGKIAAMAKDLAKRAREGGLTPEEYQGGTFTTSNLGMFDVDRFIAIINPPQAGILAIGSIAKQAVWDDEREEFVPKDIMNATISADHRVTDGVAAAEFLQEVKRLLQNPMLLLVS
ncbi:MAG: dihydrolipoamide acetyltransferase family protein [Thermomicrobiaceae bacterium]